MTIKENMYVRTKNRTLQCPQIARIIKMSKDSGYKNQYYIELDKNLIPSYEYHIYEEDISKASFNPIELIEAGDYVNGLLVMSNDYNFDKPIKIFNNLRFGLEDIKSIVTKEQFNAMKYEV
jgi:hypothetical protein